MSANEFTSTDNQYSLARYLNPDVFEDSKLLSDMRQCLQQGKLVVIKDAFREKFANRIHQSLDAIDYWPLHEDYSMPGFHYHHHNIYNAEEFPDDIKLCNKIFNDPASRQFVADLTGRDCSENSMITPSWYMPGDYSTPHNDLQDKRTVAFIWHLTRGWQRNWGGDLFWCDKPFTLPPTFNTLSVFNVSTDSMHFVMPVAPIAETKRLTLNGWFQGQAGGTKPRVPAPVVVVDKPRGIFASR